MAQSIIFEHGPSYLISHKLAVDMVYKGMEIDPTIFNIQKPYKNQVSDEKVQSKRKRKKPTKSECSFIDSSQIKEQFEVFIKACREEHVLENIVLNADPDNSAALRLMAEIHKSPYPDLEFNGGNSTNVELLIDFNSERYLIPPNCIFFNKNISKIEDFLDKNIKYDSIVMDPPWRNKYIRRLNSKVKQNGYSMLHNEEIAKLPIEKYLKEDGMVFIWCTNNPTHKQEVQENFFKKWNLKLVTTWHWVKITKCGLPICDFTNGTQKQPFEIIFVAVKVDSVLGETVDKDCLLVSVPSVIHSHKPPLLDLIKRYIKTNQEPNCLEIFARYLMPGFTSVGLEVLKLQNAKLFTKKTCIT